MLSKDPFRFKPYLKRQIAPKSPPIAIKMSLESFRSRPSIIENKTSSKVEKIKKRDEVITFNRKETKLLQNSTRQIARVNCQEISYKEVQDCSRYHSCNKIYTKHHHKSPEKLEIPIIQHHTSRQIPIRNSKHTNGDRRLTKCAHGKHNETVVPSKKDIEFVKKGIVFNRSRLNTSTDVKRKIHCIKYHHHRETEPSQLDQEMAQRSITQQQLFKSQMMDSATDNLHSNFQWEKPSFKSSSQVRALLEHQTRFTSITQSTSSFKTGRRHVSEKAINYFETD